MIAALSGKFNEYQPDYLNVCFFQHLLYSCIEKPCMAFQFKIFIVYLYISIMNKI